MKPTKTYEEILEESLSKTICFVDVRSPQEYQHSTIPGAVNLPILDDKAREAIGTLYVRGQIEEAKQYGVEWAASQLPTMYRQYQALSEEYDELVIFCSRGGMRSNSIYSLLKALGMHVSRLGGGYKAYRHYVIEHLDVQLTKVNFITLYGLSGSGKTDILKELAKQGAKVLDLEACANHRGSLLGSIGLTAPHTQKTFESLLVDISREWRDGEIVFTEGESKRIGKVMMPPSLYTAIQEGQKVVIEASLEQRVRQIHHDYVENSDLQELITTLSFLNRVISPERVKLMQAQLEAGQADAVIEQLLVSYYDPQYRFHQTRYDKVFINQGCQQTARAILDWQKANQIS